MLPSPHLLLPFRGPLKPLSGSTLLLGLLWWALAASPVQAQWQQLGSNLRGEGVNDFGGLSVCLSADGTTVAFGAPGSRAEDPYDSQRGRVRVLRLDADSGQWWQQGLPIDGITPCDKLGHSVALSADGRRLAVGVMQGGGLQAGYVLMFQYSDSLKRWQPMGAPVEAEASGDWAGYAVDLSADGRFLAVGAPHNDGGGKGGGHVRVYQWMGDAWLQYGDDIDAECANDKLGSSVALSADGQALAVGAYRNCDGGPEAGHVRVYRYSGRGWRQIGGDIDGARAGDHAGWSVALADDGATVAIGAPDHDGPAPNTGQVRVLRYTAGAGWQGMGPPLTGAAKDAHLGWAVALSADGRQLALGAPDAGSEAAPGSGRAAVYRWSEGQWQPMGRVLKGQEAGDAYGYAVSLSADGRLLAVGAPFESRSSLQSGLVQVFQWRGEEATPPQPNPVPGAE